MRRSIPLLAFVVLTLAIASATVTFSVVDTIVLRTLPYARSDRLISAGFVSRDGIRWPVSMQDYFAWLDRATAFDGLAAYYRPANAIVEISGTRESLRSIPVSSGLLRVIGVEPILGRGFTLDDERPDTARVALISQGLWTRVFGERPDVLSQTIVIRGTRYSIVGVLPAGVEFPIEADRPLDVWLPLTMPPGERIYDPSRGRAGSLQVVARLRDGVTVDQGFAELNAITGLLARALPDLYRDNRLQVEPLRDALLGRVSGWMMLVLWAVGFVLLLACVNVANLLLVRGVARQPEIAIRAAMGATRGQIARSLIRESMLIAGAAGAAGVFLSAWVIRLVRDAIPVWIPRAPLVTLDDRVLVVALAATVLTGLVCGLVPAWLTSRADLISLIKSGNVIGSGAAGSTIRRGLIVAQIAIVAVVLVSTTLFVTSFVRVTTADLGFERHNLLEVALPVADREVARRAVDAVSAVPGVTRVGVIAGGGLPLYSGSSSTRLTLPGADERTGVGAEMRNVSPGYLAVVGTAILRGRDFTDADTAGAPFATVLDERAADALFGGRDPIGATVSIAGFRDFTVVGIAANVRHRGPEAQTSPQAYFAFAQSSGGRPFLAVRTALPAATMLPSLVSAVVALVPPGTDPPVARVVDDSFRELTADRRFNAAVLSAFGVLSLLIGGVGIYGVMAFSVEQRTREIAIRSVLGATRGRVTREVLADATGQVLIGGAIGLVIAWMTTSMFEATLFGVSGSDWRVYAEVIAIVVVAGLAAALIPARRAARLDPARLFR